jgi:hypothetical protein
MLASSRARRWLGKNAQTAALAKKPNIASKIQLSASWRMNV